MIYSADFDSFEQEVVDVSYDIVVVAIFYTTWCKYSATLIQRLQSLSHIFDEKVKVVLIDVEKSDKISDRFVIKSIPDTRVYIQGKSVEEFLGTRECDEIFGTLSKYAQNQYNVIIQTLSNIYKANPKEALDMANVYKEKLYIVSDFRLLYAKILLQLQQQSSAIDVLQSFDTTNKHYDTAKKMLRTINKYLVKDDNSQKEMMWMYTSAIECIGNDDIYEAINLLVQIVSKDKYYSNGVALNMLSHILNTSDIDETLKQSIVKIL